jgi:uncharacterized protein involved in exopolysaccharide biosynthesis
MDARLNSMEETSNTLESLEREHTLLDGLVRTSRASYEQAQNSEQMDHEKIVSVDVLDSPEASSIPAKPNHLLFALAGIVFGMLGAMAIVAHAMVFRQTLVSLESVERIVGIRVLATLPERA